MSLVFCRKKEKKKYIHIKSNNEQASIQSSKFFIEHKELNVLSYDKQLFTESHCKNESAYFRSCRDCPSYLASVYTVRDLLLPAETTVHEKCLPAETVHVILLPAETLGRKLNHTDSLCRKLFPKHNSLNWKKGIADSIGGSQI